MIGIAITRDTIRHTSPGVPNSVNTKIVMIITMIRKFVPQRTCTSGYRSISSGSSVLAVLEGGDRLVLGAVVLEDAVDVLRPADQPEVADEDRDAEDALEHQREDAVAPTAPLEPRERAWRPDDEDPDEQDQRERHRRCPTCRGVSRSSSSTDWLAATIRARACRSRATGRARSCRGRTASPRAGRRRTTESISWDSTWIVLSGRRTAMAQ